MIAAPPRGGGARGKLSLSEWRLGVRERRERGAACFFRRDAVNPSLEALARLLPRKPPGKSMLPLTHGLAIPCGGSLFREACCPSLGATLQVDELDFFEADGPP